MYVCDDRVKVPSDRQADVPIHPGELLKKAAGLQKERVDKEEQKSVCVCREYIWSLGKDG